MFVTHFAEFLAKVRFCALGTAFLCGRTQPSVITVTAASVRGTENRPNGGAG